MEATSVSSDAGDGFAVCRIRGDVDIASAPLVRNELNALAQDDLPVILDVSGVGFMDSLGLSVLVAALNRFHARGVPLVVAAPQQAIREVIEVTGLVAVLPVFGSEEEAVAGIVRPVAG